VDSSSLTAYASAAALLLVAGPVHAHELDIDRLRLWLTPVENELRGELTFDPELTRSLDAELSEFQKRASVTAFVARELTIDVDGRNCSPALTVRELYERGGAAAGDIVMLSCPLKQSPSHDVTVTVGSAFPKLVITGAGLTVVKSTTTSALDDTTSDESSPSFWVITVTGGDSVAFHRAAESPTGTSTPSESPFELGTGLSFFKHGLDHVVPRGVDHLLFVAALTLGTHRNWRHLAGLLSLFTLAHTIAVAWVAGGMWAPPSEATEPCIAATIAAAGFAAHRRAESWHAAPLIVVFGLIHGLGFASDFTAVNTGLMPFVVSVVSFNLGVEAAQGMAVLILLGVVHAATRRSLAVERVTSWCALAITAVGVAWTLLRLMS
jgi:hypothetical protein